MAASTKVAKISSVFRNRLFKNKVALVTGGGTGIGKAITQELLYLGCNVMIASRKVERLEAAVDEIRTSIPGCQINYTQCNIRQEESVKAMVARTLEEYGKIDFLVNNGGGQFYSAFRDFNFKGWNAVVETNLTGTYLCLREVYQQWMKDHGGAVVNIIAEMFSGMPGMSHSGAARAGVENLTKTLAVEWADDGIRINCVCPGNSIKSETATANYGPAKSDIFESNLPTIPLGRLGKPEEVSAAVCYLLCPAASFVTGTTMIVDGGEILFNARWPTGRDNTKAYSWEDDCEEDNSTPKSKL
ncbi:peroxisomal trans-2-enoyl-CoA reductase-like [Watersipora subatra]|uniref:peroxisomal trans-2-enoyl-CoA reductase-like n=1 Tax=Watersipora subatra TaxID=2589382 RepID=UPI00355C2280